MENNMTKDKIKQRVVEYAYNYLTLNEIFCEKQGDKIFVQLEPSNFMVEITFEEMQYRAKLMLESELEGIKRI
jgi:hypothetical protein